MKKKKFPGAFLSWLRSPLPVFCFMQEADFRCSQAAMANCLPTVRLLKITKQSHSEHRQWDFDIFKLLLLRWSTCRNTRCRRCAVIGVAFQKAGVLHVLHVLHLCQVHSQRCLLQSSWGYASKCYANKYDWSKYATSNSLMSLRSERNYTGLLFISFDRFFFSFQAYHP